MSAALPGPYGWNPTPEHIADVEAEITRQREQRARRIRAELDRNARRLAAATGRTTFEAARKAGRA